MKDQELTQYEKDEKVFTRQSMDDKYGLGDFDEWEHKVLLRFDGRPNGVNDFLSHDLYKLTNPDWLDFLDSPKYELLDDDPTMIWEDTETHETWVLFDSRLLRTGEHLNKTENQMVVHVVEIKSPFSKLTQSTGNWKTVSVSTHTCLTKLDSSIRSLTQHFRVPRWFVEKELVIDEETENYGCYSLVHTNQTYYIHVYREEGKNKQ